MSEANGVAHFTKTAVDIGPAMITVDGSIRALHARLHSAGHLIGFSLEEFGWRAIKGHHWPSEARVVFEASGTSNTPDLQELECIVNGLIKVDHVRVLQLDGDERKVGFGNLPTYHCGGTHVARLKEIGKVVIEKIKEKKGQLSVFYTVI
jgi:Ser-tRNA(Ala) deacylase AlaX